MKLAPKRRSFWQYNKDNKYWLIFLVISPGLAILAAIGTTGYTFVSFLVPGIGTLIAGFIDWKQKG